MRVVTALLAPTQHGGVALARGDHHWWLVEFDREVSAFKRVVAMVGATNYTVAEATRTQQSPE